jgi:phenylpyruvate tautomerase PptA (4-oxalocrotonate tautomerase family)
MPLVKITIRTGQSGDYKKSLLDGVHRALVQAFRIPEHDRFQTLIELDHEHFEFPPTKTDHMTVIEISAFKGWSFEAKKQLYQNIVANLAKAPGIAGDDIMIILHEPPLENWGIRGGKAASEVKLGFTVEV